jgi:ABC-type transport system involved in multi-copper enzyme maturation permease subunit
MKEKTFRRKLRVILAIASKDTLDALKNRTILTLALGILALMLSAKTLPFLLALRGLPTLAIYNPSELPLVDPLQDRDDLNVVSLNSEQEMKSSLVDSQRLMIGLVLPNTLDLDSGEEKIRLDGFYPNWANPKRVRDQVAFFEEVLSNAAERDVLIQIDKNVIYPTTEPGLHLLMAVQTGSLMILLVGLILVPYLFLDEKDQHTMDALLVSPASHTQIVIGKALAGLVYVLVAAAVVLLFNFRYIVHWELILLSILLGATFSVLIGLFLGILVDSQATLGIWSSLFLFLFIGPSVIGSFVKTSLPDALIEIMSWTPGFAFNQLMKSSMYKPVFPSLILKDSGVLITSMLLVFFLIVWQIRRMDQ